MHQLASMSLSFILSPVNWILLLIILSYFLKSPGAKKKCRLFALGVFLLFSNPWLLNRYARYWQPPPRNISSDTPYSCAILLGGFGSPDERDNSGYFNSGADRFIQAVKWYKQGKIRNILVAGGNGKKDVKQFNEGEWAMGELVAMGIPRDAILFEDRSENTADNAANTKDMLLAANLKPPYLLITSAYHMPRATLLFKHAGVNTVAFPCNYSGGKSKFHFRDLVPDAGALLGWNLYLKETAGFLLYRLKG